MLFTILLAAVSAVLTFLCCITVINFIYWLRAGKHLAAFGYSINTPRLSNILGVFCFILLFGIDLIGKNLLELKNLLTIWFIIVFSVHMILGMFCKNQIKEKAIFTESLYVRWDEITGSEKVVKKADGKFIDSYILLKLKHRKLFWHNIKIRNTNEDCEVVIMSKITK